MMYFEKGRITNRHKIKKMIETLSLKALAAVNAAPHGSVTAVCKVSPSCYRRSLWEDSLLDVVQRK